MAGTANIEEFETHITVSLDDAKNMYSLKSWAAGHGLKCTHIILERGLTISQPMLTRHGKGTFSEELEIASCLSQDLSAIGFPGTRIKIETVPWSRLVPQSSHEAISRTSGGYFEHHIKLLLPSGFDSNPLVEKANQHSAHLSRNALKVRNDGLEERFVTQRCCFIGRLEARQQFEKLLESLWSLGYPILDTEEEFVLYDSNTAMDAGWISHSE